MGWLSELTVDALDTSMQVISLEVLDQEDIHYKASAKLEHQWQRR